MLIYFLVLLLFILAAYWLAFYIPKRSIKLPPMFEIDVNIDKSFKPQERLIIFNALADWERATHGLVQYNIINKETEFVLKNTNGDNSLNFVRIHSKHPCITTYEKEYFKKYNKITTPLGIAWNKKDTRLIYLIQDRMINKEMWRRITLHEIGHTLGLNHTKKRGTVMYPFVCGMSSDITSDDIHQLIYNIRNYLAKSH